MAVGRITTRPGSSGNSNVFTDLKIVDCDSHFSEPADLWVKRAGPASKSRMPVQRTVDGRSHWYLDGKPWAGLGGNVIEVGREKVRGQNPLQPFERIDPAAWDVSERLKLLDWMGISGQILYPNAVGFSSNHIFAIEDLGLREMVLTIYNDFLSDVQQESNGRLYPQGLLPIWDMEFTIREMTRLLDKGMRGFTFSDKPELLGLAELPEPYFDPLWDLLNESGAVANFHVASGERREDIEARRDILLGEPPIEAGSPEPTPTTVKPYWRYFGPQRKLVVEGTQAFMSNARIIANLCISDLFDRYPKLKVVSVESGIGWIPYFLEALEYQLDEMVTRDDELKLNKRRPTEYFRDHIFTTFWFEQLAPSRLIEAVGINNVMVETDIPHPTCLYPGARAHFEEVLADVDPAIVRRVLQDNAIEVYNIPAVLSA